MQPVGATTADEGSREWSQQQPVVQQQTDVLSNHEVSSSFYGSSFSILQQYELTGAQCCNLEVWSCLTCIAQPVDRFDGTRSCLSRHRSLRQLLQELMKICSTVSNSCTETKTTNSDAMRIRCSLCQYQQLQQAELRGMQDPCWWAATSWQMFWQKRRLLQQLRNSWPCTQ